jgi:formylmethanofuran dehydrogenase subunit E
MGLLAGELLGLELPQREKRLVTLMETDGCAVDGVLAATGCRVGRRTLFIFDFGKVAATFVDTAAGRAVRIAPHPEARSLAWTYAPGAQDHWHAMLAAYQVMPAAKLLQFQPVRLTLSLEALISQPGLRVICAVCGEEIMNGREVLHQEEVRCRGCAGQAYFVPASGAGRHTRD